MSPETRHALLERVVESQSRRIIQLEAELKLVNPDSYLAKVEGYSSGYHDGYADGTAAQAEEIAKLRAVIKDYQLGEL
jgi:hypothetical protein